MLARSHSLTTELNIDSILADATSYEFSMSEDYDAATLLETFASVETRIMDGENLVDTQRIYTSPEGPTGDVKHSLMGRLRSSVRTLVRLNGRV